MDNYDRSQQSLTKSKFWQTKPKKGLLIIVDYFHQAENFFLKGARNITTAVYDLGPKQTLKKMTIKLPVVEMLTGLTLCSVSCDLYVVVSSSNKNFYAMRTPLLLAVATNALSTRGKSFESTRGVR